MGKEGRKGRIVGEIGVVFKMLNDFHGINKEIFFCLKKSYIHTDH